MGYKIDLGARNRQRLWNLRLSREGKVKVWTHLNFTVANVSDAFRNDAANRVPGLPRFKMQMVFRDDQGDGRIHGIEFVIEDSAAAYGVLKIVGVNFQ